MKARPVLASLDPNQRYSVSEAILYLRSSRKSLFADIKAGRIESLKDGRRRYFLGEALIKRSRESRPLVPTKPAEMRVA
jgi:hypothetical protein